MDNSDPFEFSGDEMVETGFTVAVNEEVTTPIEEPAGLTPEGIQAAKALVQLPAELTPVMLSQIAREIAQDLALVPAIIRKFNLTQAQYDWLSTYNEFFKGMLAQEIKDWQGVRRTQDRLRMQAAAALEEQLPKIASRMGSQSEKLGDVVEAAKLFAKVAGVDTDDGHGGGAGERYTISIDLGADTRITIGPEKHAASDDDAQRRARLQEDPEGHRGGGEEARLVGSSGGGAALRQLAAGTGTPAKIPT